MYYTNKIKSILFDMDGTVLESEGLFARAEHALLKDYGVEIDIRTDGSKLILNHDPFKKGDNLNTN